MQKLCLLIFIFCSVSGFTQTNYYWSEAGSLKANNYISVYCPDTAGNMYVGGQFTDSLGHVYVAKWDGNTWKELGGAGFAGTVIRAICTDPTGNVYATGEFKDANNRYYVAKWDGARWSELGTGSNSLTIYNAITSLYSDPQGNIYVGGDNDVFKWNGTSWSPLGTGANGLNANNPIESITSDAMGNIYAAGGFYDSIGHRYVAKWNGVSWSQLGTDFDGGIFTICFGPDGYLYASGGFADTNSQLYVAKWNGSTWSEVGNLAAVGSNDYEITDMCISPAGNIYIAENFNGPYYYNGSNWDTLPSINPLNLNGSIGSLYALALDKQGNLFAGSHLVDAGGYIYPALYSPVTPGDVYVFLMPTSSNCGATGSVAAQAYNGTPPYTYKWSNNATGATLRGVSAGNYSVTVTDALARTDTGYALVQNTCYSWISGIAFNDVNNNCTHDSADELLPNYYVQAVTSNGTSYYANTDANGRYSIDIKDSGTCIIYPSTIGNCAQASVCGHAADTVVIPHLGDTLTNVNIAITGAAFDLTMHPGWTSANPGFTKQYWIMPFNISPVPVSGLVTIVFTYDPNLIYDSSAAPYPVVDVVAHTLTYTVNGSAIPLRGFDWNSRYISYFTVPSNLSLSYQLQTDFVISPTAGDCDTSNNHLHFSQPVTGSHDPNSKEVSPAGSVISEDTVLTYTINYQNTGTDSTNFIIVKDTLSSYLNPATVVNLAGSDKYSAFNISGTGILTWTFNPLRIPNSATSATTSKGFIVFSVKKKAGLPIGTTISNSATIYFDYNTGVQTNTVTDTIAITTGIVTLNKPSGILVTTYPNPFKDVTHIVVMGLNRQYDLELFDVTSRLQLRRTSIQSNEFNLSRGDLPSGIYLYRIIAGSELVSYGKLVVE